MDETRNSRTWAGFWDSAKSEARAAFIGRPMAWLSQVREKARDLPKTNYDLGCDFADAGMWKDAIFRFRVTLYLRPEYPSAWFNLGCCYFRRGEMTKARDALRHALQQTPDNRDAIYMLTAIDPAAVPAHLRPTRMPLAMVTQYFEQAAPQYDAMELQSQYQGGQIVFDAVRTLVKVPSIAVVDLGCGTGIASRPWRAQAKEITGVDCTAAMQSVAAATTVKNVKIFDRVLGADIGALGEALPAASADLVLCVNAAPYVGDLQGLMQGAARLAKPGGFIAITSEPYAGAGSFGLVAETGRFGHTPEYVRNQATALGLSIAREMRVNLYPTIPAQLQVFAKP